MMVLLYVYRQEMKWDWGAECIQPDATVYLSVEI